MHCVAHGEPYTIFGYKGKQVRDNIHSYDLVNAFWHFYRSPRVGEVYNIGGSRHSNCSVLEALELCEQISGAKARVHYSDEHRSGDHIWYVSDVSKFRAHYPEWGYRHDLRGILSDIYQGQASRKSA
jgi:CDP-paratose 2-epimerase